MNIHRLLLTGGESDLPVGQQAETKTISASVRLAKGAHAQLRSMEETMAQISPTKRLGEIPLIVLSASNPAEERMFQNHYP